MLRPREAAKRPTSFCLLIGLFLLCPVVIIIYISMSSSNTSEYVDDVVSPRGSIVSSGDQSLSSGLSQHISTASIKKKIAYAITVTKDGHFLDGALVLGHAAKKVHDSSKGFTSDYDADLVAFVAPGVVTARPILEAYGWRILEKRLPVELADIENREYAENMKNSGCCGADEFLKLWAYTLTEYHRVVHLDMDSIIFKSMVSLPPQSMS